MKRIAAILLTMAVALCAALPVFAAGTIEVTEDVSVSDDYDWTRFKGQNVTLNVYNWGEYISNGSDDSVDVVAAFEKLTGIKVNYTTFDSNESLYAKLKSGAANYDVIIPSDYMVAKMINEGMLAPAYAMSYGSFAYLLGAGHGLTGEVGSSAASMLPLKSISADHPYGSSEVSMEPMTSQLGNFVTVNTCSLTAPMQRVYGTGHDSTGENAAALTAPSPTLAMYGGASASLSAPFGVLSITATSVGWGKSALTAPMATLVSDGRVSGMANAALAPPMAKMVGYSGAVCDVTLTGRPTLVATGTTGAIGGATLTCPLFALVAGATAENHGSANLIAPSPRMGDTAQAWLVAPMARLVAIGSATVTVDYEAYSINLTHSDPEATDEVTRYTNFPFERIVRYQGSYFGMAADGLYLLEGNTDDGAPIEWALRTGTTDFGKSQKKNTASGYVGGRLGPSTTFTVLTGEKQENNYPYTTPRGSTAQNYRQKFGRGLDARYYAFQLEGDGELEIDDLDIEVVMRTRRI